MIWEFFSEAISHLTPNCIVDSLSVQLKKLLKKCMRKLLDYESNIRFSGAQWDPGRQ